jgi:hypothetical protein
MKFHRQFQFIVHEFGGGASNTACKPFEAEVHVNNI